MQPQGSGISRFYFMERFVALLAPRSVVRDIKVLLMQSLFGAEKTFVFFKGPVPCKCKVDGVKVAKLITNNQHTL